MCKRAEGIGCEIHKVVFRGFQAPEALQRMHDEAIEKRTALTLESETEEQAQYLQDFKLNKEFERAEKNQDLEKKQLVHRQHMENMRHQQVILQEQQVHDQKIKQQKEEQNLTMQFYNSLKVCIYFTS